MLICIEMLQMAKKIILTMLVLVMSWGGDALAAPHNPLEEDARIRTLVYREDTVFLIKTKYGFQSNVEFDKTEKIKTISIGDPVAFRVIPSGHRLFIKALKDDQKTNMTVITDRRAYQIELSSHIDNIDDIRYVTRFYYPAQNGEGASQGRAGLPPAIGARRSAPSPVATRTSKHTDLSSIIGRGSSSRSMNFSYSVRKPDRAVAAMAPVQIYDNGRSTFFKFASPSHTPAINEVLADGLEAPLPSRVEGEYVIIDRVLGRFSLRYGNAGTVCVYNDNIIR